MPTIAIILVAAVVAVAVGAMAWFVRQAVREEREAAADPNTVPLESETQSINVWSGPRHLEDTTVDVATRGRRALEDHEQPWMAGRPAVGRVPAREVEVRAIEATRVVRALLRRNWGRP